MVNLSTNWSRKKAVQDVDIDSHKVVNVTDPAAAQDAATKNYVDTNVGKGYTLYITLDRYNPVASTIRYFGALPFPPQTTEGNGKIYIRKAGTITIANILVYSGTAGTAEAWSIYLRLNSTTDYLIETVSVSAFERVFSNTGLSIPVVEGDYFEMKTVHPDWATSPATTMGSGYVYIV